MSGGTVIQHPRETTASKAPAAGESTVAHRRILVIDDNEAIHADFRKTLCAQPAEIDRDLAADEALIFGHGPGGIKPRAQVAGFDLQFACQGQEGHARVAEALREGRPYQLAFVDMRMPPGWDGVQTIQNLWQLDPDLQVVICSAYSDYSWEQVVQQLGATDRLLVLKKPFDDIEVCQLATAMTEKWRLTRQARLTLEEMRSLVRQRTAELERTALHDKLTGLPNRAMLHDALARTIAAATRDPQRAFGVLFLDFDRFKVVNDSLGHEIGDLLLIGIADRLRDALRATDVIVHTGSSQAVTATAARLGGDEFIVLLDYLSNPLDAARVAARLLEVLSRPYQLKGNEVHSTASIGVTTSAVGYTTPEDVIRDADNAMYRAKAAGKARYVMFDKQMHAEAVARLTLENDLRHALLRSELFLEFQPVISLRTGLPTGAEALLRWRHPTRGIIPPGDFIPLAEETGLIIPIGAWVLGEACRQLAIWRQRLPQRFLNFSISVNVSRRQLVADQLATLVAKTLAETGLPPTSLTLEITESIIMEEAAAATSALQKIHCTGVKLHMDDFGTGYSSLSCLHRFPLRGIKIDRAFIANVSERRDYAAVVNAIVTLARNLDVEVVAEGVESADQVVMLQALGCEQAQGFHFSRPIRADALETYLNTPRQVPKPSAPADPSLRPAQR